MNDLPTYGTPTRLSQVLLIVVVVAGYAWWLLSRIYEVSYDKWVPLLVAPLLVLISIPLLLRISSGDREGPSFSLLLTSLILKLAAAPAYIAITNGVYGGVGDYNFYHVGGASLAESYRRGVWDVHVDAVPGYGTVQIVTAVIYRFTGSSLLTGFLVFSWLAFWGLVMFVLAVRTALPRANLRRYAGLVLLLPSTVYWTSALGKDAWVVFALGVSALGAARLSVHRKGAFPLVFVGLAATGLVRPHVALMVFAAVVISYLGRRSSGKGLGNIGKFIGIAVLSLAGVILLRYAAEFLKVENLSPGAVNDALSKASRSSAGGGATIGTSPPGGPLLRIPWAVVTVLFRPFLWEAHNLQAAVAATEGAVVAVLAWRSRSRLWQLPRLLLLDSYILFVVTYGAMFVFAFSSFANLGTLARERVQLFPLLVVLLCLPEVGPRRRAVPADRPLAPPNSVLGRPDGPRLRV